METNREKISMAKFACAKFNAEQLKQIRLGIEDGVSVSVYASTNFDAEQMKQMRLALSTDISVYNAIEFAMDRTKGKILSAEMMRNIRNDILNKNINVSLYANPRFDNYQMKEIRLGLCNIGEKFIKYIDEKFDSEQLRQIRLGIESDIDVDVYANPDFNSDQMYEIRLGLMVTK